MPPSNTAPTSSGDVKVWDLGVRAFHWSLVLCFFGAYILSDIVRDWHEYLGYTVLGLLAFRLLWGFWGSKHARFSDFYPSRARLFPYLKAMLRGQEPRFLGHNPAASVMIFFLLALCLSIGVSGYLLTTDWGFGNEALEDTHEVLVNITLGVVAIHVAAAVYESKRHKENLITSMITGLKRKT